MSRLGSPGDQSVCVVLTCRKLETDWILLRSLQEIVQDGAARRREPQGKGPRDIIERRHCPITANKFAAREGERSVRDW